VVLGFFLKKFSDRLFSSICRKRATASLKNKAQKVENAISMELGTLNVYPATEGHFLCLSFPVRQQIDMDVSKIGN
jgi:hypothetical protein